MTWQTRCLHGRVQAVFWVPSTDDAAVADINSGTTCRNTTGCYQERHQWLRFWCTIALSQVCWDVLKYLINSCIYFYFYIYFSVIFGWTAWLSGRTSVSGQRSFAVLRSTCSWQVTTYVGKPSAIGQPTRPTQPFMVSWSVNEYWAAIRCSPHCVIHVWSL